MQGHVSDVILLSVVLMPAFVVDRVSPSLAAPRCRAAISLYRLVYGMRAVSVDHFVKFLYCTMIEGVLCSVAERYCLLEVVVDDVSSKSLLRLLSVGVSDSDRRMRKEYCDRRYDDNS